MRSQPLPFGTRVRDLAGSSLLLHIILRSAPKVETGLGFILGLGMDVGADVGADDLATAVGEGTTLATGASVVKVATGLGAISSNQVDSGFLSIPRRLEIMPQTSTANINATIFM